MEYITSKNYERFADLLEKGEKVIAGNQYWVTAAHFINRNGFHFGFYNSDNGGGCLNIKGSSFNNKEEARQEFISWCKDNEIEFVDFESQHKTEKEIIADELYDSLFEMVKMWKEVAEKIPPLGNEKTYLNAVNVINKIKK